MQWDVVGNFISSNATLKDSRLNDSKAFQSFCQEHCEKSVLVLDIGEDNQLNIRRESHYKSSFDCIFFFVSKSWAVQTALGFSFFSLLRSLYQVPPPTLSRCMPQGLVIRAEVFMVKLRV